MDTAGLLVALSECCGTSGRENEAAAFVERELSKYAEVKRDNLGNVIGKMAGDGPRVMLEAHLDEIGLVVTGIDEEGFIKVEAVGGVDRRVLPGCEVVVFGKYPLPGVVCTLPPHLTKDGDRKKVPAVSEMAVDIGFGYERAKELVSPGDRAAFKNRAARLLEGQVCGKALDNRAGVAALLRCAEMLSREKTGVEVAFAFCTREETGQQGATAAAFSVEPDIAVAVDVSYGLTPDSPKIKCGRVGGGPMIGVAPVLSKDVTDLLFRVAKDKGIAFQTEIMAGRTGTDADVIAASRSGVKTGLVSVPLKYMHTPVEVVDAGDVEAAASLLCEFVKAAKEGILL